MIHTHIAPGEIRERVIPTENDRRQKASSKKALVSHSFHINACTVLKINLNVFFLHFKICCPNTLGHNCSLSKCFSCLILIKYPRDVATAEEKYRTIPYMSTQKQVHCIQWSLFPAVCGKDCSCNVSAMAAVSLRSSSQKSWD